MYVDCYKGHFDKVLLLFVSLLSTQQPIHWKLPVEIKTWWGKWEIEGESRIGGKPVVVEWNVKCND